MHASSSYYCVRVVSFFQEYKKRPCTGHYQHQIIPRALAAALFAHSNSPGASFPGYYQPFHPNTIGFTLALVGRRRIFMSLDVNLLTYDPGPVVHR